MRTCYLMNYLIKHHPETLQGMKGDVYNKIATAEKILRKKGVLKINGLWVKFKAGKIFAPLGQFE